jgi:serine/threonine-protein kinase RsbW
MVSDPGYGEEVTATRGLVRPVGAADPDVVLALPAIRDSVGIARQMVLAVGDRAGIDDERNADIAIAVSEACANVVAHAYGDDEEDPGDLWLEAWLEPERMVLLVRDEGPGFAPRYSDDRGGLGLGLPLMIAIADEVTFRRGEDGANEVLLAFAVESPA